MKHFDLLFRGNCCDSHENFSVQLVMNKKTVQNLIVTKIFIKLSEFFIFLLLIAKGTLLVNIFCKIEYLFFIYMSVNL